MALTHTVAHYLNLYADGTVGTVKNCRTSADIAARPHRLEKARVNPRVALIKVRVK